MSDQEDRMSEHKSPQEQEHPYKDAISGAASLVTMMHLIGRDIWRIEELVLANPDFFNARPGDTCMECAATKLEALVREQETP